MTKQEIDALVEAMHPAKMYVSHPGDLVLLGYDAKGSRVTREEIRQSLYLAAGLNADGSEKARVVRAALYLVGYADPTHPSPVPVIDGTWDGTTFTPDGAA